MSKDNHLKKIETEIDSDIVNENIAEEINKNVGGHMEMEGIVLDAIRGVIKVQLDSGQVLLAHLSGKMRQNKILILPEDRVRVKVSPYDITRGIVVRRMK